MRTRRALPIVATFSLGFATIAFISDASTPARAQTYDPSYPVCMQIYGQVGYFDCRYNSIEQCKFLAVGRSASCVVNPYFPQRKQLAPRRSRRTD